ncbi:MAG: CHAT domain-containing protein [Anaerolineae bacterium]|nr:CHAT domain-containing protein [Anaerolineae bacterium]
MGIPRADGSFADVEIRIFSQMERGFPVEITLDGEQEYSRGYLSPEILSWVPTGDATADGKRLFETLFADSTLLQAWSKIHGQATCRRVRLRIDVGAAALHALPWEELYADNKLLSAAASTPFSRYLPIALPWGGGVAARPLRVLALISNPADLESQYELAPLDVVQEREILERAFAQLGPDEVTLDFLAAPVTLERLETALREGYHLLHYVGHGAFNQRRERAVLFMQDEDGQTALVSDADLAQMLARQDVHPQLIFLAACQSATRATGAAFRGLAPKLVSVGVPAVIAMQDFVTVETAHKLCAIFYQRLLEHGQVDVALNEARSTLLSAARHDATVPVLFMRLKSGQLWGTESDARGTVLGSRNPRIFWTGLLRMIQRGKCTPIIGPRVHGYWLPTPDEVALVWSELHDYPFPNRAELLHVAQYLSSNQGRDFPRYEMLDTMRRHLKSKLPAELRPEQSCESLSELVAMVGWPALVAGRPHEIHQLLASLNLPLYLTTNFDSFMGSALQARGKKPTREICRWHRDLDWLSSRFEDDPDYVPTPEEPLVYHLFGNDEEVESLVLTEDNYLDYLVRVSAEMDRIPTYIRGAIANSSLMFLGYSLHDWEFRVILRGLVATLNQRRRFKHVAVQLESTKSNEAALADVQHFLQQYFQDAEINVFWGSTQQFMAELREQWEALPR